MSEPLNFDRKERETILSTNHKSISNTLSVVGCSSAHTTGASDDTRHLHIFFSRRALAFYQYNKPRVAQLHTLKGNRSQTVLFSLILFFLLFLIQSSSHLMTSIKKYKPCAILTELISKYSIPFLLAAFRNSTEFNCKVFKLLIGSASEDKKDPLPFDVVKTWIV